MKRMRIRWRGVLLPLLGVGVLGCSSKPSVATAPEARETTPVAVVKAAEVSAVTDLDGKAVEPLAGAKNRRGTVLLFITDDCPISNGYAPEIRRICEDYMKRGIAFYLVYSDPSLAAADAKKHYAEYSYNCTALLDPRHELAHKAGATITPEAAVFAPGGERVYLGRINDLYVDFGKARFRATTNDLRDVLEQVAVGKPVTPHTTMAIGCTIPL
jgi:hypothetical protein